MDVMAIVSLAEEVAALANNIIAAHKAGNQADFNTAWVAMQGRLQAANAAWVSAGGATAGPVVLGSTGTNPTS